MKMLPNVRSIITISKAKINVHIAVLLSYAEDVERKDFEIKLIPLALPGTLANFNWYLQATVLKELWYLSMLMEQHAYNDCFYRNLYKHKVRN